MRVNHKSEGVSILLAVLLGLFGLFGIGHLYVGRLARGLWLLFGGLVFTSTYWIPLDLMMPRFERATTLSLIIHAGACVLWIWTIFDARKVCREHNRQALGGY
jgi:hypothetical protein